MIEVILIEEVTDMCEDFFVMAEIEGELVGELPLIYAAVPVFLDAADEGVQDLAELEVGVHSTGYLSVEYFALVFL